MRRRWPRAGLVAVVALPIVLIGVSRGEAGRSRPEPRVGRAARVGRASRSWRAYETNVDPGSGIEFVSRSAGFALSGQPLNTIDHGLSGPDGLELAWPSPSLLVTRDGGRAWQPALRVPGGFWGLDFGDSLHGIAVGVQALYRTADGGRHWHRVQEPSRPLVRVSFADPEHGVGLTTSGGLMATDDGGSTWHPARWAGRGVAARRTDGSWPTIRSSTPSGLPATSRTSGQRTTTPRAGASSTGARSAASRCQDPETDS